MEIVSARHKGLRRFLEHDDPRGLPPDLVERIRNMLTALIVAETLDALESPPGWRVHQLGGRRKRTWSLSVSGNWRLTFTYDGDGITDLDLEDYH